MCVCVCLCVCVCVRRPTYPSLSWRSLLFGGDTVTLSGSERSWRGRARWDLEGNLTQSLSSTWFIKSLYSIDRFCTALDQGGSCWKICRDLISFSRKVLTLTTWYRLTIRLFHCSINCLFNCYSVISRGCSFVVGGRPSSPRKSSFPAVSVSRG